VAPLPMAPLAAADALVRIQLAKDRSPMVTAVVYDALLCVPGGVPGVPDRFVDAEVLLGGDRCWVSAEWLHGRQEADAVAVLAMLHDNQRRQPGPLAGDEDGRDLFAYLLASRPDGMISAGLGGPRAGLGCALPGSAAVLHGHELVIGGADEATDGLLDWIEEWRLSGRPGLRAFRASLHRRNSMWDLRFETS